MLITAGPGTGKTRTLTSWIENLLNTQHVPPESILAITFTNKAAREMRERLAASGHDLFASLNSAEVRIATFHGFCYDLLRENDSRINIICDHNKRLAILSLLMRGMPAKAVRQTASGIQDYLVNPAVEPEVDLLSVTEPYLAALSEMGAVDLAGLISAVNALFEADPAFLNKVRSRFAYIAVDEFQDINLQQFALISRLAAGKSVLAIGDPDQAIYGFRGSDVRLFFSFKRNFTATELHLSENYRSSGNILMGASCVIAGNTVRSKLRLETQRAAGDKIRLITAENLEQEAAFIAAEIESLVGGMSLHTVDAAAEQGAYAFSDLAILYRLNAVGKSLAPFLHKTGIPVGLRDRQPLLEQEPYTLVNSMLCCLLNDRDLPAWHNCLLKLYPEAAIALPGLFDAFAGTGAPFPDFIKGPVCPGILGAEATNRVLRFIEYMDSLRETLASRDLPAVLEAIYTEYLQDSCAETDRYAYDCIVEMAAAYGSDLAAFYRQIILSPHESEYPYRTDKVNCLSFHAAKGLEFPVVFLIGAEAGITPLDREGTDQAEERRLFYVAMTRARERLYISRQEKRRLYGRLQAQAPSPFLKDIPPEISEKINLRPAVKKQAYRQQMLF